MRRFFLLGLAGIALGSASAQPASYSLAEPVAPDAVLYTARTVQLTATDIEVVTTLFRASSDGTAASELAWNDCPRGCMVRAIRADLENRELVPGEVGGPGGWAVVKTSEGARIEIDSVLVGRGLARLGMPPGDYTLTLRSYGRQSRPVPLEISVAREGNYLDLFSRAAPVLIRAEGATPPALPLSTPLTRLDSPRSGWRMTAILDAQEEAVRQAAEEAAALAAAEAAAQQAIQDSLALADAPPETPPVTAENVASASEPPSPDTDTGELANSPDPLASSTDASSANAASPDALSLPAAAPSATPDVPDELAESSEPLPTGSTDAAPDSSPEVEALPPSTDRSAAAPPAARCSPQAEDPMADVQRMIREAAYEDARDCLQSLADESRNPGPLYAQVSALAETIFIEGTLDPREREFAAYRRENMVTAYERGERSKMLDIAEDILSINPSDLATIAILTDAFRLRATPDSAVSLDFVYVPGPVIRSQETSILLATDNVPEHGFLLGTKEVTNAQFARFLTATEASRPNSGRDALLIRRPTGLRQVRGGWGAVPGLEELPVVDATLGGAQAFAEWAGGRLPHRNEWLWAYQSADAISSVSDANLATAGVRGKPVPPGSYDEDALGLSDMIGNVWEWVEQRGATLVAGGSFRSNQRQLVNALTKTASPDSPNGHVGFRVLRPLDSYPDSE
ncbi:MAG: hypothetical protein Rubg2KO_06310 [Rubricoccaceae bacterium]